MLEAHFRAVADEGDLPIVVYNVPSRTGTNVDAATFLRLAEHPRVIAVKEASGNLEQIARICARAAARRRGPRRRRRVDPAGPRPRWRRRRVGRRATRSPGELVALCAAARAGDWDAARRIHERWLPLFLANFRGAPNPVPVKAALAAMGLLDGDAVRAPLLPLDAEPRAALAGLLRRLGIVEVGGRPDRDAPTGRPWHDDRRNGATERLDRRRSPTPSSTTSRPGGSAPPNRTRPSRAAGAFDPT